LEQANDIREAIANIKTSISNMDEQMEKQFKGVIKDVNAALPTTFKTLFGGGEAKIVYTDPNDILNSGIEIKIQPPGKKITNLNLLSGGEKSLVALSVLFSILSVRPLPLVILDEVEAPLDIANVERFAKYIRTFTTKTQFMIVTHRMGTMENCDILYGATMEQKGITKIVNVNLIEAKKMTSAN
jgi:chromosome segregation protein